jgi:hypothetical protein
MENYTKMKKVAPFLIAFVFFITACGTASPQSDYAAQAAPALEKLAQWQTHYAKLVTLFNDPVTSLNGNNISRLQMIELYNMSTDYQITRQDYVNLGFSPLDILVGESNRLADEGREIQDLLSPVTPDQSIRAAQESVLRCVQTRSKYAQDLASAIKDLKPIDLNDDDTVCNTFDADLKKLTDFVNDHK